MQAKILSRLKTYRLLSIILLLLGAALLAFMVTVEGEPGAIPLFLCLTGILSFLFIQKKINAHAG